MCNARLYEVAEVSVGVTGGAVSKASTVHACLIDAQITNNGVAFHRSGIRVESERESYWYVQALDVRACAAASGNVIDPQSAVAVVVSIVVTAVCGAVNAVGNARPLHVIACSFEEARVATGHRVCGNGGLIIVAGPASEAARVALCVHIGAVSTD